MERGRSSSRYSARIKLLEAGRKVSSWKDGGINVVPLVPVVEPVVFSTACLKSLKHGGEWLATLQRQVRLGNDTHLRAQAHGKWQAVDIRLDRLQAWDASMRDARITRPPSHQMQHAKASADLAKVPPLSKGGLQRRNGRTHSVRRREGSYTCSLCWV